MLVKFEYLELGEMTVEEFLGLSLELLWKL